MKIDGLYVSEHYYYTWPMFIVSMQHAEIWILSLERYTHASPGLSRGPFSISPREWEVSGTATES